MSFKNDFTPMRVTSGSAPSEAKASDGKPYYSWDREQRAARFEAIEPRAPRKPAKEIPEALPAGIKELPHDWVRILVLAAMGFSLPQVARMLGKGKTSVAMNVKYTTNKGQLTLGTLRHRVEADGLATVEEIAKMVYAQIVAAGLQREPRRSEERKAA